MIAITLPRKLIDKIVSGEKTFELRKTLPREIFPMTVFVVEKGTRKVPYTLYIDTWHFWPIKFIWHYYSSRIGITEKELYKYANGEQSLFCWHISKFWRNSRTFSIDDLDIKKAPQSFVYINKERRK